MNIFCWMFNCTNGCPFADVDSGLFTCRSEDIPDKKINSFMLYACRNNKGIKERAIERIEEFALHADNEEDLCKEETLVLCHLIQIK